MRKLLKTIYKFEDVTVTSNIDITVEGKRCEEEKDVYEYEFLLTWDEEQAKAFDAKVVLVWSIPCVDVQYMWHPGSRARRVLDAALQVLNTIFGVTQFSKVIGQMRPEHREMVTFWLKFARDNGKVLQQSEFIPYEPHFLYPVIKAFDAEEEIIGVYACNKVIQPDPGKRRSRMINATKEAALYLKLAEDCEVKLVRKDCRGHVVSEEKAVLHQGVIQVEVPRSGLLEMSV